MPYLRRELREKAWEDFIEEGYIPNSGTLNFLISTLCDEYISNDRADDFNYSAVNTVIGALECAKQEFYRRIASPYEDYKKTQNGEVYTLPRY
jgi:hypothetical protein